MNPFLLLCGLGILFVCICVGIAILKHERFSGDAFEEDKWKKFDDWDDSNNAYMLKEIAKRGGASESGSGRAGQRQLGELTPEKLQPEEQQPPTKKPTKKPKAIKKGKK